MFGMPGGIEWIVILVISFLIFGRRLPSLMSSMGKGIVEFKKGVKGIEDDTKKINKETENNYSSRIVKDETTDML